MIVDVEKLIARHLRDAVDLRVVGKTPSSIADAWIRLTLLDAPQAAGSTVDHSVDFYVQLDCYAGADGGQPEATALGISARDKLLELAATQLPEGICSAVRINGMSRIADTAIEPARERMILTATVTAHPAPA